MNRRLRFGLVAGCFVLFLLAAALLFLGRYNPLMAEDRGADTVSIRFWIPKQRARILPRDMLVAEDDDDFYKYGKMQVALLKSRFFLNAVVRKPRVAELSIVREQREPAEWLERVINVGFPMGPEVMRIWVAGDRPEELKILVKAVADTYLTEVVDAEKVARQKRYEQLKRLFEDYDKRLADYRDRLRRSEEAAQTINGQPTLRRQALVGDLQDCQRELRRVRLEAVATRERMTRLREGKSPDRAERTAKLEEDLAVLQAQQKVLEEEKGKLLDQADRLMRSLRDAENARAEIATIDRFAQRLAKELEILKVELRAPDRVRLLDEEAIVTRAK